MLSSNFDLRRCGAVLTVILVCVVTSGFVVAPNRHTIKAQPHSSKELLRSVMRRSAECKNRCRTDGCDHPLGLIITCIDYRIRLDEVLGEDFGQFDMVRLPGAALTREVIESVGLAVDAHKVRLLMVLEHSDCAMDRLAAEEDRPGLARLQWHRRHFEAGFAALSQSPNLRNRIAKGELLLVRAVYDVKSNEVILKDVHGDVTGIEDVVQVAGKLKR